MGGAWVSCGVWEGVLASRAACTPPPPASLSPPPPSSQISAPSPRPPPPLPRLTGLSSTSCGAPSTTLSVPPPGVATSHRAAAHPGGRWAGSFSRKCWEVTVRSRSSMVSSARAGGDWVGGGGGGRGGGRRGGGVVFGGGGGGGLGGGGSGGWDAAGTTAGTWPVAPSIPPHPIPHPNSPASHRCPMDVGLIMEGSPRASSLSSAWGASSLTSSYPGTAAATPRDRSTPAPRAGGGTVAVLGSAGGAPALSSTGRAGGSR